MRLTNTLAYCLYSVYLGSLGLAFTAAHSFLVLGLGEMLLGGVALLYGPLVITYFLAKENLRLAVLVVHVFLAVLLHPEVLDKELPTLNTAEQFELLREVNGRGVSWWVKAETSYDLARWLQSNAKRDFKISSPFWYWAFPPSVVLTFWGVVFFFRFPIVDQEE